MISLGPRWACPVVVVGKLRGIQRSRTSGNRELRVPIFSYGPITTGWEARAEKSGGKLVRAVDQRTCLDSAWRTLVESVAWCHARDPALPSEQNGRAGNAGLQRIGCASGRLPERQKTIRMRPLQWPRSDTPLAGAGTTSHPRKMIVRRSLEHNRCLEI
jgi:hypothetical protein